MAVNDRRKHGPIKLDISNLFEIYNSGIEECMVVKLKMKTWSNKIRYFKLI
jgi:hypothetical protein